MDSSNTRSEMPMLQSRRLCPMQPSDIRKSNLAITKTTTKDAAIQQIRISEKYDGIAAKSPNNPSTMSPRRVAFDKAPYYKKVKPHPTAIKKVRYKHTGTYGEMDGVVVYDSKTMNEGPINSGEDKVPLTLNTIYSGEMMDRKELEG